MKKSNIFLLSVIIILFSSCIFRDISRLNHNGIWYNIDHKIYRELIIKNDSLLYIDEFNEDENFYYFQIVNDTLYIKDAFIGSPNEFPYVSTFDDTMMILNFINDVDTFLKISNLNSYSKDEINRIKEQHWDRRLNYLFNSKLMYDSIDFETQDTMITIERQPR